MQEDPEGPNVAGGAVGLALAYLRGGQAGWEYSFGAGGAPAPCPP